MVRTREVLLVERDGFEDAERRLLTVSERLDRFVVATSRESVEIPGGVHDLLLVRLSQFPDANGIVEKFESADATGLVTLTPDEEAILHEVAEHWIHEVGFDMVPSSVVELREVLKDFFLSYSRGEVEIEWDSRNLLLKRLEDQPAAADIVVAFRTAGPSHLRLTDKQMSVLRNVVAQWLDEVGLTHLPPGIFDLHIALEEHDHDAHLHAPGE
jgi:hypothetical protein